MAKYKIIPSTRTIVQSPISIGHKAEKGVEAIEFDVTAWVETYGSGTLTVIMRRWGDAIPYPIALEIDENNKATWTLSDTDTAKAGMAYAQLSYVVGETVVKKSDIYTFRVMDSLTGEGDPPEAYESWLEHLTHLAAEAMAEVLDIEGIVTDKTLTVDGGIADAKKTGDELSALKADLGNVESFFRKASLIEGHLNAGVTSTAISDTSSKYVSVYFPVVQGRTYTIDKKYVTQYTRLGYTTTVPALLMEISDYNNLGGGGNTYRTFTAAKTGYACILIYASDVDTNVDRADIEASVVAYEGEYDSTFEARMEIVNLSNIEQMELDIERLDSRMPSVNLIEGKINASFSGQSMTLSSNAAYLTLYFPVKSGETYTIDKKQVTSYFRVAFCSDVPVIGESLSNYISVSTSVKYTTFIAPITGYCVVTVVASSSQHIQLYRDTVAYQGEYNPDITKTSKNITGINNLPHTFYCGPNRELSTLKAGIEEATKYMDSTLYVDAGTYDLISEFGSEFFDGLTSSDTLSGLVLKNRIHIIFSPNSKVTSHYTGSNQYAQSLYSPFNAGKYGFTLENLNLECSNCRYAVHDERNGGEEQYASKFINCKMSIDNSANSHWTPRHCIGGGLGSNANVLVDNCIFESDDATARYGVYYHIQNRSSISNYRTILTIKDCYFITGTVSLDDVSNTPTSTSDNSEYFVHGCSFPSKYSGTDNQGVFVGLAKSYNLRIWGNEVRSAS